MSSPVTIIIDAFRAAATACEVLAAGPLDYFLVFDSGAAERLAADVPAPLLIGKPEIGASLPYDLPNSPTRVSRVDIPARTVIHRTNAGGGGVLAAPATTTILLAGLVNLSATVRAAGDRPWVLHPMGHEGVTPSLEDDLTAALLTARREGRPVEIAPHLDALRHGPGRYFFSDDQAQYPAEDFVRCTSVDAFDFAVRAEHHGNYARLMRA